MSRSCCCWFGGVEWIGGSSAVVHVIFIGLPLLAVSYHDNSSGLFLFCSIGHVTDNVSNKVPSWVKDLAPG